MQLPTSSTLTLLTLTSLVAAHPDPHYDQRGLYARYADAYAEPEPYYSDFDLYARNAYAEPDAYAEAEPYDSDFDLYARALYTRDAYAEAEPYSSDFDLHPRDAYAEAEPSAEAEPYDSDFKLYPRGSRIPGTCSSNGYKLPNGKPKMTCKTGDGSGIIGDPQHRCQQPNAKEGDYCDSEDKGFFSKVFSR